MIAADSRTVATSGSTRGICARIGAYRQPSQWATGIARIAASRHTVAAGLAATLSVTDTYARRRSSIWTPSIAVATTGGRAVSASLAAIIPARTGASGGSGIGTACVAAAAAGRHTVRPGISTGDTGADIHSTIIQGNVRSTVVHNRKPLILGLCAYEKVLGIGIVDISTDAVLVYGLHSPRSDIIPVVISRQGGCNLK